MGVIYPQDDRDEVFKQKVKLFMLKMAIGTILVMVFVIVILPIIVSLKNQ